MNGWSINQWVEIAGQDDPCGFVAKVTAVLCVTWIVSMSCRQANPRWKVGTLGVLAGDVNARLLGRRGKFAGLLAITVVTIAGTSVVVPPSRVIAQTQDTEKTGKNSTKKKLTYTVLSAADEQPLAGATVEFRYFDGDKSNEKIVTGADGKAEFVYPERTKPAHLRVNTHRPGHVPFYTSFDQQPIDLLPIERTIRMQPGEVVGGVIVDPQGNPISGAVVNITAPTVDPPRENHVYHLIYATTETDGVWKLDSAPVPVTGLRVSVKHDEFENAYFDVKEGLDAKYVLKRGWTVRGTVTDSAGQPVTEAKVIPGDDRFGSSRPTATTDEAGAFLLAGLKKATTMLTVTAAGFAPQMQEVVPEETSQPDEADSVVADFKLEPGKSIEFRFTDPAGKPIKGVGITADTWRGYRTVDWRGKSDDDGIVRWDGAPDDVVIYDSYRRSFRSKRDMSLIARDEPYSIVLNPEFSISGIVTDELTGLPIDEMEAGIGWRDERDIIRWWPHDNIQGRFGKFTLTYNETKDRLFLRVQAKGYRPWVSEELNLNEPAKTANGNSIKIQLTPATGPSGLVVTPTGQPAAGATIALGLEGNSFQYQQGYRPYGSPQKVETDREGRFELQPLGEPKAGIIAVIHESGYAELSLDKLNQLGKAKPVEPIELQAWARVRCEVIEDGKPAAAREVSFRPERDRNTPVEIFSYSIDAKTDTDGIAVLDRVVPRDGYISMVIVQEYGNGATHYSHAAFKLELEPGQEKTVQFGGSGQAVIGRIELPPEPPGDHAWPVNEAGTIKREGTNDDDRIATRFRFLVNRDGTFRVPDLPVGRYTLALDLTAKPSPDQCGTGRSIGSVATTKFEITGDKTTALDLGTLQGEWTKVLGVGTLASNFVTRTADDRVIRLDEFVGRYVVLDFWATWCGPCLADMPRLRKFHDSHAGDDVQVIAVSLDSDFSNAVEMAKDKAWPWTVASGGTGYRDRIPSSYDVTAIPVKFLIGTDGKILYRGMNLDELSKVLVAAKQQTPFSANTRSANPLLIHPSPVEDAFQPDGRLTSVIAVHAEPYNPKQTGDEAKTDTGVVMYDDAGKVLRNLPGITPSGWLKRPDRIAVDIERERFYAGAGNTLHCLSLAGQQLFDVPIDHFQSVAVDPATGDIWCLCASQLESGCLVVLDNQGHEKTRYPIAGFSIRYSPADEGFWIIGKTAKLISCDAQVLVEHDLPEVAYTLAAMTIDPQGGCWALEDSHPDIAKSRERCWRITREGIRSLADFREIDFNTEAGVYLRNLTLAGEEVWIGMIEYSGKQDEETSRPKPTIHRYSRDGKSLGSLPIHARQLASGRDGSVWALTDTEMIRLSPQGQVLNRLPRTNPVPEGVHQSDWIMDVSK